MHNSRLADQTWFWAWATGNSSLIFFLCLTQWWPNECSSPAGFSVWPCRYTLSHKKAGIPGGSLLDWGPSESGFVHPWSRWKQPKTAQEDEMFTPVDSSTWWMLLTFDNSWRRLPNNWAWHRLTTTFKPELLAAELSVLKSLGPCCQWYFCRVFQFSC